MSQFQVMTVDVHLFTIKEKEDGKRYLMRLYGDPSSFKEFREAFMSPEDYDFRTIRWLDSWKEAVDYTPQTRVDNVYDSEDNPFFETKQ